MHKDAYTLSSAFFEGIWRTFFKFKLSSKEGKIVDVTDSEFEQHLNRKGIKLLPRLLHHDCYTITSSLSPYHCINLLTSPPHHPSYIATTSPFSHHRHITLLALPPHHSPHITMHIHRTTSPYISSHALFIAVVYILFHPCKQCTAASNFLFITESLAWGS